MIQFFKKIQWFERTVFKIRRDFVGTVFKIIRDFVGTFFVGNACRFWFFVGNACEKKINVCNACEKTISVGNACGCPHRAVFSERCFFFQALYNKEIIIWIAKTTSFWYAFQSLKCNHDKV